MRRCLRLRFVVGTELGRRVLSWERTSRLPCSSLVLVVVSVVATGRDVADVMRDAEELQEDEVRHCWRRSSGASR